MPRENPLAITMATSASKRFSYGFAVTQAIRLLQLDRFGKQEGRRRNRAPHAASPLSLRRRQQRASRLTTSLPIIIKLVIALL